MIFGARCKQATRSRTFRGQGNRVHAFRANKQNLGYYLGLLALSSSFLSVSRQTRGWDKRNA